MESAQLPTIDFIKMDIEGHESNALLGAQKTIQQFKPIIAVELDLKSKTKQSLKTQQRLEDIGYQSILIPQKHWFNSTVVFSKMTLSAFKSKPLKITPLQYSLSE